MKNSSIAKRFSLVVIISMIFISVLCIISVNRIYEANQNLMLLRMKNEASKLEKIVNHMFDYSSYILTHINSQIHQKGSDIDHISKLVKSFKKTDEEAKNLFATSLFSWVNKDLYMVASSNVGELQVPIELNNKNVWTNTIQNPGILQLGNPIGGWTSGEWIIPCAIGLVDADDQFIGSMGVGIDIGLLKERLEENLTEYGMNFIIIDNRNREIITESNRYINRSSSYNIVKDIDKIDIIKNPKGLIDRKSILDFDMSKTYYRTANYPYIVAISYDSKVINREIIKAISPQIIIFAAIFATLLSLLYIIHYSIISPLVKLSNFTNDIILDKSPIFNFFEQNTSIEFINLAKCIERISYYISHEKTLNKELSLAKIELENAHKELLLTNENLEQKVLDRTEELENAVSVKSNFLSNMSHEIRTPIHGVINFAKFLVKQWNIINEEKKLDIANKIYKNSGRLLSLINNLLDLSKLDSKNMVFSMLEHNFVTLAEDTIEEVSSLIEDRCNGSEIRFFNFTNSAICKCDNERITQVMRNLIANAIKFGKNKPINIELSDTEINIDNQQYEAIKFTVIDQGLGIPVGEEKEIFEKFIESTRTRTKAGGTGLGLSISKEIINSHNGYIWGVNNPDGGSSFSFIIPKNSSK